MFKHQKFYFVRTKRRQFYSSPYPYIFFDYLNLGVNFLNVIFSTIQNETERRAYGTAGYAMPYQNTGVKSQELITTTNQRAILGPLDDELPYTDYNHLPVAAGYKSHDYEYGYSYIPPEKWYPQPPRPPICVTEKRMNVCPSFASGLPADLKEFHTSRRITPPDQLNEQFVSEKLNSGR